jgi:hypothetical protein
VNPELLRRDPNLETVYLGGDGSVEHPPEHHRFSSAEHWLFHEIPQVLEVGEAPLSESVSDRSAIEVKPAWPEFDERRRDDR